MVPQGEVAANGESRDCAKGGKEAVARFDEITEYGFAFLLFETRGQPLDYAPCGAAHEAVSHFTPRLTFWIAL